DVTSVNPSGTPQAFALSFADVTRLSTLEGPFPDVRARGSARNTAWFLRTPSTGNNVWSLSLAEPRGRMVAGHLNTAIVSVLGARPALIINPN
ncbi:MAG: hypothetical protein RSI45_01430, partial [Lactococcus sp.]